MSEDKLVGKKIIAFLIGHNDLRERGPRAWACFVRFVQIAMFGMLLAACGGSDGGCPGDQVKCGGECVDLQTDTMNCGSCGQVCTGRCVTGTCGGYVFVTDAIQPGNLGGLAGGDNLCQQEAVSAGLDGTFQAWLSDSTASAADRLTQSMEAYFLPDGTVVANDFTDLTDGTLNAAISLNAQGEAPAGNCGSGYVWTSTASDGSLDASNFHCNNWTTDSGIGGLAFSSSNTSGWTSPSPASCSFTAICSGGSDVGGRLYCFEQ